MGTLKVIFKNHSGATAANVFVGFFSSGTINIKNLKPNGKAIKTIDNVSSFPNKGNWYSLTDLSKGIAITSFSGRIYVCYDKAWAVQNKGYQPAQTPTDPNFYLRYDKMEITFNGDPSDVANLTSVDYWSIPMTLDTYKVTGTNHKHVGSLKGILPTKSTKIIYKTLNKLSNPTVSGLSGAIPALVPGKYTQVLPGPKPGTTFARILAPNPYPPIPGVPVVPYDTFDNYLSFLLKNFGPTTSVGAKVPSLGKGIIANIAGTFNGVSKGANKPPPSSGPQAKQVYSLKAKIDANKNITLEGSCSKVNPSQITMKYEYTDLINPTGIYGGNTHYILNGTGGKQKPVNDVYGWIGADLFAGLNIGAIGSSKVINGHKVGALESEDWFALKNSNLFKSLQSGTANKYHYNQWAATLATLSQNYNFAYTDRFDAVQIGLNPATVNCLEVTLESNKVK